MIKESELLRRAVKWISEQRLDKPESRIGDLLDEAGKRFNLSPMQVDSLLRILKEQKTE